MTEAKRHGGRRAGDYSGDFDPGFDYEDLSKEALVRLVREYGLIVHLLDRSMCAAIGLRYGAEAVKELAIEEWAGASPVYGDRLRQIMNVEGDGVSAIFKVLQLDPGFPHHYMDVHYELVDETHGYFELAYCGALMDAEPFGRRDGDEHVPPHRGRHVRRDGAGGQPQGAHPPRAPPAARARRTARRTAAGRS